MKITSRIVQAYLNCKYKAYLLLQGETGTPHDYEVLMNELQAEYRPRATEALLRSCKLESAPSIATITLNDLERGHPVILDCIIEDDRFQFHFDALKKVDGKSSLGRFCYIPVLFHHEGRLREEHKLLLSFGAFVVSHRQGLKPEIGKVISQQSCSTATVELVRRAEKLKSLVSNISRITSESHEVRLSLNKHCDVCEFRTRCMAEAVEIDDLSLLRGMPDAEIEKQRSGGLFTLNQLSYTFRPRRRPKHLRDRPFPHYFSLQAQALREK